MNKVGILTLTLCAFNSMLVEAKALQPVKKVDTIKKISDQIKRNKLEYLKNLERKATYKAPTYRTPIIQPTIIQPVIRPAQVSYSDYYIDRLAAATVATVLVTGLVIYCAVELAKTKTKIKTKTEIYQEFEDDMKSAWKDFEQNCPKKDIATAWNTIADNIYNKSGVKKILEMDDPNKTGLELTEEYGKLVKELLKEYQEKAAKLNATPLSPSAPELEEEELFF